MFIMRRAVKVPGYLYTDEKATEFKKLSSYARFRVGLDIILYENLCQFAIFRWTCNFVRLFISILDVYPFLALWSFGKKIAYVEIMKKQSY